ncbi:Protein kinase-like domain [Pseudocohnilembus persalinus]|uniref:Protein kinase-like domain n=1 Tax=Pseudocohnilembus persalinus TaxID=266149 RepID=A0A0V0QC38_PSEPJ|nr:Protein kinase-like domain [Pseudocohnilembus persalinus]|eukprot:KRW99820.1 Protein kinase-like domain [Pseudocohnilembus persalinus]
MGNIQAGRKNRDKKKLNGKNKNNLGKQQERGFNQFPFNFQEQTENKEQERPNQNKKDENCQKQNLQKQKYKKFENKQVKKQKISQNQRQFENQDSSLVQFSSFEISSSNSSDKSSEIEYVTQNYFRVNNELKQRKFVVGCRKSIESVNQNQNKNKVINGFHGNDDKKQKFNEKESLDQNKQKAKKNTKNRIDKNKNNNNKDISNNNYLDSLNKYNVEEMESSEELYVINIVSDQFNVQQEKFSQLKLNGKKSQKSQKLEKENQIQNKIQNGNSLSLRLNQEEFYKYCQFGFRRIFDNLIGAESAKKTQFNNNLQQNKLEKFSSNKKYSQTSKHQQRIYNDAYQEYQDDINENYDYSSDFDDEEIQYKKSNLIDAGGKVYYGLDLYNGTQIAIKTFEQEQIANMPILEDICERVFRLQSENGLHFCQYYHIVQNEELGIDIPMEYLSGGSIKKLIEKFHRFNFQLVQFYIKQVFVGLEVMHRQKLFHGNIKASNILVSQQGHIKLTDINIFELNFTTISNLRSVYSAPEILQQNKFGVASDIWAAGILVLEMLFGTCPWIKANGEICSVEEVAALLKKKTLFPFPSNLPGKLLDFLKHIFVFEPEKRANVTQLLNHPYLKRIVTSNYVDMKMTYQLESSISNSIMQQHFNNKLSGSQFNSQQVIQQKQNKQKEKEQEKEKENENRLSQMFKDEEFSMSYHSDQVNNVYTKDFHNQELSKIQNEDNKNNCNSHSLNNELILNLKKSRSSRLLTPDQRGDIFELSEENSSQQKDGNSGSTGQHFFSNQNKLIKLKQHSSEISVQNLSDISKSSISSKYLKNKSFHQMKKKNVSISKFHPKNPQTLKTSNAISSSQGSPRTSQILSVGSQNQLGLKFQKTKKKGSVKKNSQIERKKMEFKKWNTVTNNTNTNSNNNFNNNINNLNEISQNYQSNNNSVNSVRSNKTFNVLGNGHQQQQNSNYYQQQFQQQNQQGGNYVTANNISGFQDNSLHSMARQGKKFKRVNLFGRDREGKIVSHQNQQNNQVSSVFLRLKNSDQSSLIQNSQNENEKTKKSQENLQFFRQLSYRTMDSYVSQQACTLADIRNFVANRSYSQIGSQFEDETVGFNQKNQGKQNQSIEMDLEMDRINSSQIYTREMLNFNNNNQKKSSNNQAQMGKNKQATFSHNMTNQNYIPSQHNLQKSVVQYNNKPPIVKTFKTSKTQNEQNFKKNTFNKQTSQQFQHYGQGKFQNQNLNQQQKQKVEENQSKIQQKKKEEEKILNEQELKRRQIEQDFLKDIGGFDSTDSDDDFQIENQEKYDEEEDSEIVDNDSKNKQEEEEENRKAISQLVQQNYNNKFCKVQQNQEISESQIQSQNQNQSNQQKGQENVEYSKMIIASKKMVELKQKDLLEKYSPSKTKKKSSQSKSQDIQIYNDQNQQLNQEEQLQQQQFQQKNGEIELVEENYEQQFESPTTKEGQEQEEEEKIEGRELLQLHQNLQNISPLKGNPYKKYMSVNLRENQNYNYNQSKNEDFKLDQNYSQNLNLSQNLDNHQNQKNQNLEMNLEQQLLQLENNSSGDQQQQKIENQNFNKNYQIQPEKSLSYGLNQSGQKENNLSIDQIKEGNLEVEKGNYLEQKKNQELKSKNKKKQYTFAANQNQSLSQSQNQQQNLSQKSQNQKQNKNKNQNQQQNLSNSSSFSVERISNSEEIKYDENLSEKENQEQKFKFKLIKVDEGEFDYDLENKNQISKDGKKLRKIVKNQQKKQNEQQNDLKIKIHQDLQQQQQLEEEVDYIIVQENSFQNQQLGGIIKNSFKMGSSNNQQNSSIQTPNLGGYESVHWESGMHSSNKNKNSVQKKTQKKDLFQFGTGNNLDLNLLKYQSLTQQSQQEKQNQQLQQQQNLNQNQSQQQESLELRIPFNKQNSQNNNNNEVSMRRISGANYVQNNVKLNSLKFNNQIACSNFSFNNIEIKKESGQQLDQLMNSSNRNRSLQQDSVQQIIQRIQSNRSVNNNNNNNNNQEDLIQLKILEHQLKQEEKLRTPIFKQRQFFKGGGENQITGKFNNLDLEEGGYIGSQEGNFQQQEDEEQFSEGEIRKKKNLSSYNNNNSNQCKNNVLSNQFGLKVKKSSKQESEMTVPEEKNEDKFFSVYNFQQQIQNDEKQENDDEVIDTQKQNEIKYISLKKQQKNEVNVKEEEVEERDNLGEIQEIQQNQNQNDNIKSENQNKLNQERSYKFMMGSSSSSAKQKKDYSLQQRRKSGSTNQQITNISSFQIYNLTQRSLLGMEESEDNKKTDYNYNNNNYNNYNNYKKFKFSEKDIQEEEIDEGGFSIDVSGFNTNTNNNIMLQSQDQTTNNLIKGGNYKNQYFSSNKKSLNDIDEQFKQKNDPEISEKQQFSQKFKSQQDFKNNLQQPQILNGDQEIYQETLEDFDTNRKLKDDF